jgi:hypothetical protein
MLSKLKAIWARLASVGDAAEAPIAAVDYKGYRIKPTPYRTDGHYQTAGIIEKDGQEGVQEHRFVRADMHPSRDGAIAFTIAKAQQIIDLEGDRIFKRSPVP